MEETRLKKLNTDTGFLKLFAALSMLIDHVGMVFFPHQIAWRVAGRLAFPIFAFCVVVGCVYTSNIKRYFLRLLIFAVVAQPFFVLLLYPWAAAFLRNLHYLNVIFTLLFGAAAVYGLMDFRKRWWLTLLALVISLFVQSDYQLYGVLLMLVMYIFRENRLLFALAVGTLLVYPLFVGSATIDIFGVAVRVQSFAVLSLPLLMIGMRTKIKTGKYFFYAFYPGHLCVIFLMRMLLRS